VSVSELKQAQAITPIVSVQNRYNLIDRHDEAVLNYADEQGIAFIPWFPLATGKLATDENGILMQIAKTHQAQPAQIALAWLLQRSDVILPIPGTRNIAHLKANIAAQEIVLTPAEFDQLSRLAD
jgi:aryl-alcohol dehydrogenase-like predicted oxidoreductase